MITLREILRGSLTRFLPGIALGVGILYGLARLNDRVTVGWLNLTLFFGVLTLSYLGALMAIRMRLRADAGVAGRRSFVAGILSPAAFLCGLVLFQPRTGTGLYTMAVCLGLVLGFGMFFPWLKPAASPALTDAEARALIDAAALSVENWGAERVREPVGSDHSRPAV